VATGLCAGRWASLLARSWISRGEGLVPTCRPAPTSRKEGWQPAAAGWRPASAPVALLLCPPVPGSEGGGGWCRHRGRHPPVGKKGGNRPRQGGDRPPRRSLCSSARQCQDLKGEEAGADLSAGTHPAAGNQSKSL